MPESRQAQPLGKGGDVAVDLPGQVRVVDISVKSRDGIAQVKAAIEKFAPGATLVGLKVTFSTIRSGDVATAAVVNWEVMQPIAAPQAFVDTTLQ